jgi:hypothetical protein
MMKRILSLLALLAVLTVSPVHAAPVAPIDLSSDAPVGTRTTSSGVTPVHFDLALGSKTYAGYQLQLQVGQAGAFTTILQDVMKPLTEADLVSGATIDWTAAHPALSSIGATDIFHVRVVATTALGTLKTSPWSNSLSPTDAPWNPSSLSNLIVWVEPTAGHRYSSPNHSTPANSGDPVADLADLSGAGNDPVQPASTAWRPIATDAAGKSYLTFDGSDDALFVNNSGLLMTDGSGNWTAAAAVKFNSVSGVQSVVDGDFPVRVAQFIRINGGHFESIEFDNAGSVAAIATGSTTVTTGVWYNVVAVCCASSTLKIYLNGSLEATASVTGTPQSAGNPFGIGANNASSAPGAILNGAESVAILRASGSSAGDITNLNTYLASTHP